MTPQQGGPVAAIDCGSNSTRLLVAGPRGAPVLRTMTITRLGQGVDATGSLSREAIDRTVAAVRTMKGQMDELGVRVARLVATSAVRDADNKEQFLDAASGATGLPVEILTGDEEGRLAYAGATADLDPGPGDDVVVDIGGGSTELTLSRTGDLHTVSLDLGCVRLTERRFHHDPPLNEEILTAVSDIRVLLDVAEAGIEQLASLLPGSRLLGLAGTVSTIAALELGLAEYDRDRIHGSVLSFQAVSRWCTTLAGEDAAHRAARPGITPGREDVILGGVLILREVMDRLQLSECLVSESDILDGIVLSLLQDRRAAPG